MSNGHADGHIAELEAEIDALQETKRILVSGLDKIGSCKCQIGVSGASCGECVTCIARSTLERSLRDVEAR